VRLVADTSVWVEYLRRGRGGWAGELDELLQRGEVLMCGPVLAELLAGLPSDRHSAFWVRWQALPWAELERSSWRRVGRLAGDLRRAGATVPLTDVMIAVAAARAGAALWSADSDFERLTDVMDDLTLRYQRPG
jgi:predicted nucleic acid-binding protein